MSRPPRDGSRRLGATSFDDSRAAEAVEQGTRPAGDGVDGDADRPTAATSDPTPGGRLAGRAGDVVSVELERALRAFDDGSGVPPEARRVLSTMAVRIAVGVVRPPVVAADDGRAAETMSELFRDND